jgi:protein phosphatase
VLSAFLFTFAQTIINNQHNDNQIVGHEVFRMKFQLYQPQAINELGGRSNQEDSIYPLAGEASAERRVFVVCDGMGGLDKGEVASEAVSKALGQMADAILSAVPVFTDEDFRQCLSNAYDALDAADPNNEASMGTTMTFLCFHDGGCMVAHIGDSRIYHLRPSLGPEKGVLYRSRDHSLVQQLYEQGEISYEEMKTSPRKNVILKAMQPHLEQRTGATLVNIMDVKPGDYFYLCTDGMLERMEDSGLMSIVCSTDTDEQKRQRLINATAGNADNHSAYLIQVKDVTDVEEESDNLPVAPEPKKNSKISVVAIGLSVLSLLAGIAAGIAVFL